MTETVGFDKPCARTLGQSCATCWCRLPGDGWLPCPPEAQGLLRGANAVLARNLGYIETRNVANQVMRQFALADEARSKGYTGNFCTHCYGVHMRLTGTCEVCADCGESGACG